MSRKAIVCVVAAALGVLGSAPALAAEQWATGNVGYVYPQGSGNFVVTITNAPATCTNPANPKYFHIYNGQNGVNADGVKAMLAVVLTAHASGKQIQIAFDDSTSNCYVNRLSMVP